MSAGATHDPTGFLPEALTFHDVRKTMKVGQLLVSRSQAHELPIIVANIDEAVTTLSNQPDAAALAIHQALFDNDAAILNH
jgi:hypothetical protein